MDTAPCRAHTNQYKSINPWPKGDGRHQASKVLGIRQSSVMNWDELEGKLVSEIYTLRHKTLFPDYNEAIATKVA